MTDKEIIVLQAEIIEEQTKLIEALNTILAVTQRLMMKSILS